MILQTTIQECRDKLQYFLLGGHCLLVFYIILFNNELLMVFRSRVSGGRGLPPLRRLNVPSRIFVKGMRISPKLCTCTHELEWEWAPVGILERWQGSENRYFIAAIQKGFPKQFLYYF